MACTEPIIPVGVFAGQTSTSLINLLGLCKHRELTTVTQPGEEKRRTQQPQGIQGAESIIQMPREDADRSKYELYGLLLLNVVRLYA